jgi:transposase
MEQIKRKRYTEEYKREAVELILSDGYGTAEAARNLGINAGMLGRWKREREKHGEEAFPGIGNMTAEQAELYRLKEENKRLRMEREILKKATAFFAGEMK